MHLGAVCGVRRLVGRRNERRARATLRDTRRVEVAGSPMMSGDFPPHLRLTREAPGGMVGRRARRQRGNQRQRTAPRICQRALRQFAEGRPHVGQMRVDVCQILPGEAVSASPQQRIPRRQDEGSVRIVRNPPELDDEAIERAVQRVFDFRPAAIIEALDLRRPIYRQTAAYGHFGRLDLDLPWEKLDRVELLKQAAK